jgi:hypothetical protein
MPNVKLFDKYVAGEGEVLGRTCPSTCLSSTNLTWPGLGLHLGRRDGKPSTTRMSFDTDDENVTRNSSAAVSMFHWTDLSGVQAEYPRTKHNG